MPGLHPLEVEPVPVVEADREREEPKPTLELVVEPTRDLLAQRDVERCQLPHVDVDAEAVAPERDGLLDRDGNRDELVAEALLEGGEHAGLDEDPDREQVRQDEPDATCAAHGEVEAASRSSRATSDAASRPCARRASGGVPHAGQPSTPATSTGTPEPCSTRSTASPSAPTGA